MMDYNCAKWKKKRQHILRLDGYVCQIMKRYGKIKPATIVHHIYPAKNFPQYQYCDWNLISVSDEGHNKLENRKNRGTYSVRKRADAPDKTGPGLEKNMRKEKRLYLCDGNSRKL